VRRELTAAEHAARVRAMAERGAAETVHCEPSEKPPARWAGPAEITAEDLLAAPSTGEERSAVDEAVDFLLGELADGPRPVAEIHRAADDIGIPRRTLKRAKARAGVDSARVGGAGSAGHWEWLLSGPKGTVDDPVAPLTEARTAQETRGLARTGPVKGAKDVHLAPLAAQSTLDFVLEEFAGLIEEELPS